jgi:hypothetical protein
MANNDLTIQRYLLGELPDSEQEALEKRYFMDDQFFEQMVRVEHDLNDRYVRKLLPAATRDRFEKYYLDHPSRRDRNSFAEALAAKLSIAEKTQSAAAVRQPGFFDRLKLALGGPKPIWALSLALILVAGFAFWLFLQTRHLREQLATLEAERRQQDQRASDLQQNARNEQSRSENLSRELTELRDSQTATPSPTSITFATLALTINGTRAIENSAPRVLQIPATAEQVRILLNLKEIEYPSYQIVVQRATGTTIFTSGRLRSSKSKSGTSLTLQVPSRTFPPGDYMLTLRGVDQSGEVEDVNKTLFRVTQK